jgi:hypothetical protein
MIIVSQNREEIYNWNNISDIYIAYEFKIFTDGNCLGCYNTKERAKEVLQEISQGIISGGKIYYMPEI